MQCVHGIMQICLTGCEARWPHNSHRLAGKTIQADCDPHDTVSCLLRLKCPEEYFGMIRTCRISRLNIQPTSMRASIWARPSRWSARPRWKPGSFRSEAFAFARSAASTTPSPTDGPISVFLIWCCVLARAAILRPARRPASMFSASCPTISIPCLRKARSRCRSTCRSMTSKPAGSATTSTNSSPPRPKGASRNDDSLVDAELRTPMPVPQHIFDPPFNIIRSSHVVLDVVDLNASREFYENNVGLHVEDRDDEAVYLRGSEEHQHHSLVLRKVGTA